MNYEQKVKAERLLVELRDRAYNGDKEALQELFDFAHNMLTNEYVRLKESTEGECPLGVGNGLLHCTKSISAIWKRLGVLLNSQHFSW